MRIIPVMTAPLRFDPPSPDPLGVLTTTAPIAADMRHVQIDAAAVDRLADRLAPTHLTPPTWNAELHFSDGTWRTAAWVLVLDALNFCFWSRNPDPADRWRVEWRGRVHNGYDALAAALHRAVADDGVPLWDASYLATITNEDARHILRPVPGAPEIPLFPARVANLREVGQGLLAQSLSHEPSPFLAMIERAGGSAITLIDTVLAAFPSFRDTVTLPPGHRWNPDPDRPATIRFLKRAQILIADLAGGAAGASWGAFHDLAALTAFADYKVPQVLHTHRILVYGRDLRDRLQRRALIPAGSDEEIEIRAATIWACELLRRALADRGRTITASQLDWLLWTEGQSLPGDTLPYHRTLTTFY